MAREGKFTETGLRKGQRVAVLNRSYSGKIIFEGWATVTSVIGPTQANVRFAGERRSVPRFIDWRAQQNPAAYVAQLHGELRAALQSAEPTP